MNLPLLAIHSAMTFCQPTDQRVFAYAMLAQAPSNTFAAALSLGFCPSLDWEKSLCKGSSFEYTHDARTRGTDFLPAKSLANPWVILQGESDRTCPVVAVHGFSSPIRGAAIAVPPSLGQDFSTWPPCLACRNTPCSNSI